jgi:hypothetical protein
MYVYLFNIWPISSQTYNNNDNNNNNNNNNNDKFFIYRGLHS